MEHRETSGVTMRLVVEYVRGRCGDEGVARLLELAGEHRPVDVLENPRVWSTYEQRVALFSAAAAVTGDAFAAREIGRSAVGSDGSVLLRSLLIPLRSPRALLRALPMVHSKFDAAGESELLELRDHSAKVAYRVKAPHPPSRHDCLYVEGLLSQVSVLFGQAPARVTKRSCQADGAAQCIFETSWKPKRRLRTVLGGAEHDEPPPRLAQLAGGNLAKLQLDALETTLAELLQTAELDQVLRLTLHHAGSSVAAQRLLLAVQLEDGSTPNVHAEGFNATEAEELAALLLSGSALSSGAGWAAVARGTAPDAASGETTHVLRSEVSSPRRRYGALAAFSSGPFADGEQALLDAYARLTAVCLDTRLAVDAASERQRSAEVLGGFARRLVGMQNLEDLTAATAFAARMITRADRALLLRHDEEAACLAVAGHDGFPEDEWDAVGATVVTEADTPEMARVLATPETARVYDRSVDDPVVSAALEAFGLQKMAVVSMHSGLQVFGLLVVGWEHGRPEPRVDAELLARFAGIADQAAGAWQRTRLDDQIRLQASSDPLTGLANRRIFTALLSELLSDPEGGPAAVLFCDLDDFKGVNDVLGHAAGDDLLTEVARRLQRCVHDGDLVARLGGDEFTVLLRHVDEHWSPQIFAERVRRALAEPIVVDGAQFVIRLSIGAVLTTPCRQAMKDVLRQADAAMYMAKSRGGDQLLMFEEAMLLERSERLELEASLTRAVSDPEQFPVVYQPQVDLSTGRIVAAEALARWEHPVRGRLTPDRFLAIAEETGLIVAIDCHVLSTAVRQAAWWRATGMELRVSVNVAAATLASPSLVPAARRALEEAPLPGTLLEVEITERAALELGIDRLNEVLLALSDLGISIAVDDVGTDQSSLGLLPRLPAQRIKVDGSFVQGVADDRASRSVVEAVLLLAGRLGQSVVAEGVETAEQAAELRSLGCHLGQGYLYSRPVDGEQIQLLARRSARQLA